MKRQVGYTKLEVMEMARNIDETFFDNWTEQSAYVFGYIWADGTLTQTRGTERVQVSSSDYGMLEKINSVMKSDYAISGGQYGEANANYVTGFGKPHMIERVKELGLIPRKSNVKEFPDIPQEVLRHFVRGYFDGNGHFTYENHKPGKKRMTSGFTFGSQIFGDELLKKLHSLGIKGGSIIQHKKKASSYGTSIEVRLYVGDTKKLAELMYADATIYMDRKKEYFEEERS